jgi:preprotein translocase subunit SecD
MLALAFGGCLATSPSATQSPPLDVPSLACSSPDTISVAVPTTDKATIEAAVTVFAKRLTALGVENFSTAVGDAITFTLCLPKPSDELLVRAVLDNPGVVQFLAWSSGRPTPTNGTAAPTGLTLVFDGSQIVSATTGISPDGQPAIDIKLGPDGARHLADFSSAHVGDVMLFILDGKVLAGPIIASPLTDGTFELITAATALPDAALAAILASGPLPSGWGSQPGPTT